MGCGNLSTSFDRSVLMSVMSVLGWMSVGGAG